MKQLVRLLVTGPLLGSAGSAAAQAGGGFDLTWSSVSAGGGPSAAGGLQMNSATVTVPADVRRSVRVRLSHADDRVERETSIGGAASRGSVR